MKLDILAFAAHPDDIELSAGGTLVKAVKEGRKVGIVDLTKGELGSRGSSVIRANEAVAAAEILGLSIRENLGLADGFFEINQTSQLEVIKMIRKYQPEIVLANAVSDRHPDHGKGAELVHKSAFLSGLIKIKTEVDGEEQAAWRPKRVFHYIQDHYIKPDFVVNITDEFEEKLKSIMAYSSQFFSPEDDGVKTPISGEDFVKFIEGRARQMGREAGYEMGEGFTVSNPLGVESLFDLK
ncbi:MAG TPA: bacillithiol biosynthesis deacetylase BshB1 [Flavobacteriales bacterium]|nr:bacillithiol biosynthesis deacetylase BshB1 [Flavobacteriales bacterium]|tara:strand:+ start:10756 stop:11472 length:717 start_codon:yes stop_codon:yes gene_type:complete